MEKLLYGVHDKPPVGKIILFAFIMIFLLAVALLSALCVSSYVEKENVRERSLSLAFLRKFTFPVYIVHYTCFQFLIDAGLYELRWWGLAVGIITTMLISGIAYVIGRTLENYFMDMRGNI